ncbi:MAG: DHH family phosphoesterase [Candidatus Hermodarchaeota archaeon]
MIVSITHEHDLDGLGSQAIIKRYFDFFYNGVKQEFKQYFSHYLDFVEKLKNILISDNIPSQLIITDIGFNEDFKELLPILEGAKNNDCKILWFDHHLVSNEIKEKITEFTYLYINDPLRCAAEIVKDYYLPDDSIALKIAELARDSDFKTNKFQFADELQLIIGYNRGESKYQEKIKLVSLLSVGAFQEQWFSAQLMKLKKWFNEESIFALRNVNIVNIENFGEIAISFARISGGKITDLLGKKFPKLRAYIGIDTRFDEIIIKSEFINCRDFAIEFTGGGHKSRAGFKYKQIFSENGVLNQQFIQDLKMKFIKFKTHQ